MTIEEFEVLDLLLVTIIEAAEKEGCHNPHVMCDHNNHVVVDAATGRKFKVKLEEIKES